LKPRIHIFGAPGSGKSFIASAVSKELQIPHLDLDEIFWDNSLLSYEVKAEARIRDKKLEQFMAQPSWIIEGSYHEWVSNSFRQADVIVILTTPVWVRHWRIFIRFLKRQFSSTQPEYGSFCSLIDLLKYNQAFDKKHLSEARGVIFESNSRVILARRLQDVLDAL